MIEAELKARVSDPEAVRAHLTRLAPPTAATYRDRYFDWPDHRLDAAGTETRVRTIATATGTRHVLTYKEPPVDASGSKPEHETEVADPEPVVAMLTGLGLVPLVELTKECENYRFLRGPWAIVATLVTVPELDGHFLEVETAADPAELGAALDHVRGVLGDLGLLDALDTGSYTDAVRAARE